MELKKSKPEWSIKTFLAVVVTKKCFEIVSSKSSVTSHHGLGRQRNGKKQDTEYETSTKI